jgi:hypothetical protein
MFILLSIGLTLASEFTSLEEPKEVSDVAAVAVLPTDPKKSDLRGE